MDDFFALDTISSQRLAAHNEIAECASFSERFGLALTSEQIDALVDGRFAALRDNSLVEFGGGVMPLLIHAFCDSPYITRENYAQTLAELQELFYFFRRECYEEDDRQRADFSDEKLVEYLKNVFNGNAQGSINYIACLTLEELARLGEDANDIFNRVRDMIARGELKFGD